MFLKFFLKRFCWILVFCFICVSCVPKKKVLYFQDIENIAAQSTSEKFNTLIRPGDILAITVSGLNPEVVAPFNPQVSSASGVGSNSANTYLVDEKGTIDFPIIGTVLLGTVTKQEAKDILKKKIGAFVKDPVINLRIMNFSVSILGEVNNPGNYIIDDEKITVLEALGLAGDLTIFGERETVKVIREVEGVKSYGELDFTSVDIFSSPFYYLQQNDVIVVSPNNAQIQTSGFNRNISVFISLAGIIISVITILSR